MRSALSSWRIPTVAVVVAVVVALVVAVVLVVVVAVVVAMVVVVLAVVVVVAATPTVGWPPVIFALSGEMPGVAPAA
jgi:hypothetical protein